ncbi:MAG TPA: hypothetical protein VNU73_06455, partial [Steroidobacteraceae bacterium]|nr:hypothetical protein [Steroidobacteraceae bacterium]
AALDIFEQKGAIHWSQTTDQAAQALQRRYAGDITAEPDRKRFIFAYTNEQVDVLNRFAREVHRQRGALAEDHTLATARGAAPFAVGDRVQFTDNAWSRKDKETGLVNGAVGTVLAVDTSLAKPRMTVELDAPKGEEGRRVTFIVGADRKAGEFDAIRHGYAGTIYKGQGRTLDQTYVFHSHYWREASSYVALTRHRDSVAIFVAHDTAADLDRLARQMGRDETKRAAISFIVDDERERVQAVGYDAPLPAPAAISSTPGALRRKGLMADASVTEQEARLAALELEKRQAEVARREREDRLARAQANRLDEQPDELRSEHERLRSRQREIDDYHDRQRRIAEEAIRKRQAEEEAEAKEAEIRDAKSRYAQALGDEYDIRDPYGSLARASMAEYASFRRDREELSRQIAAETDPDKRRTLELRQEIELCDYMTITSHRIAGQSEVIVGRSNTEEAVRQRAQAEAYEERGRQLRAQYREHIAEQQLGQAPEQDAEQDIEQDIERDTAAEQTAEASPDAPIPRQRGQRTSRGRAERAAENEKETEAGDAEPVHPTERLRQRGEATQEETTQPTKRGPELER